jgi:hypothetical protein
LNAPGLEGFIFVEIERFLWKCDLRDCAARDRGWQFYLSRFAKEKTKGEAPAIQARAASG